MLDDIIRVDEVYIVCGMNNIRKLIDGLYNIIIDKLNITPNSRLAIYLFCGKRCDRIEVLLHEPDRYVLLYKRHFVQQG